MVNSMSILKTGLTIGSALEEQEDGLRLNNRAGQMFGHQRSTLFEHCQERGVCHWFFGHSRIPSWRSDLHRFSIAFIRILEWRILKHVMVVAPCQLNCSGRLYKVKCHFLLFFGCCVRCLENPQNCRQNTFGRWCHQSHSP